MILAYIIFKQQLLKFMTNFVQFDVLTVFYVDGRCVFHYGRDYCKYNKSFQISQTDEENEGRFDLEARAIYETRNMNSNIRHESTRFCLADSNNSDAFYINNPQADHMIELNQYAKAKDVYKFYRVNIGPRQRPLIVLQLFYVTNP